MITSNQSQEKKREKVRKILAKGKEKAHKLPKSSPDEIWQAFDQVWQKISDANQQKDG